MTACFDDLDELIRAAPADLGFSGWVEVGPADVAGFAAATGPGAVGAGVPPYLLLSLTNRLLPEIVTVPGASSGVNYGAASVRFGPPVPVGARVRAGAHLVTAEPVAGGVQTTIRITVETDTGSGEGEAACTVDSLTRWLR